MTEENSIVEDKRVCICGCNEEIKSDYRWKHIKKSRFKLGHLKNVLNQKIECGCGCGELIPAWDKWGDRKSFKQGHAGRDKKAKGFDHYNWGGGIRIQNGYRSIRSPEHPHVNAAGYVAEHRLVMEQKLGRYLEPHEIVHHINHDRRDNRPENLTLISHSDHNRHHGKIVAMNRKRDNYGRFV